MQFDKAHFFHRHRICTVRVRHHRLRRTIDVKSMPNVNTLDRNRLDYVVLCRYPSAGAGIQHLEVSATQSLTTSKVIEHVPGNRVDAIRQRRRVDVEVAYCSRAVFVVGKQRGDVGAELVVSWVPDDYAIDHNRNGRTVKWYPAWLWCQSPTKVDVVSSGSCAALRWCINCSKWYTIARQHSFRN